jgi:hypothetical protein
MLDENSLKSLYKKSIFYPSGLLLGIAFLFSIAYWFLFHRKVENEYSEHSLNLFEFIMLYFVIALVYSFIVAILSLSIFLNSYKKIRSNFVLSALSWFLLPVGFICLVIGKAVNEFLTVDSLWEIIFALIGGIPFVVSLIIGFRKFRSLDQDE